MIDNTKMEAQLKKVLHDPSLRESNTLILLEQIVHWITDYETKHRKLLEHVKRSNGIQLDRINSELKAIGVDKELNGSQLWKDTSGMSE